MQQVAVQYKGDTHCLQYLLRQRSTASSLVMMRYNDTTNTCQLLSQFPSWMKAEYVLIPVAGCAVRIAGCWMCRSQHYCDSDNNTVIYSTSKSIFSLIITVANASTNKMHIYQKVSSSFLYTNETHTWLSVIKIMLALAQSYSQ
ncbi:hypothetical protein Tcan_11146 [Toxocara canis]|uniref:Uncharacterized protein n=1 Tax=Toxocara canis TaxID=6265 RepID=A0A0B2VCA4_TOXCA|nr:hypothetical protein Tcan_11146 [Toxocara canis]